MPTEHPYIDDPTAPRLPQLLETAKLSMLAEMRARLADAGFGEIRETHGCVFRFVGDEGMRLTDIAARAQITKQTASEVVDELERLGYVERKPDPVDRRAKIICLTERGSKAQARARQAFAEIEAEWAERYGEREMAALRKVLTGIYDGEQTAALAA